MKNKSFTLLAVLILASFTVDAQTSYFKADNNISLDQSSSWTNNNGSTPQSGDWAVWDANVSTAANCTDDIGSSANWGGIQILNPAATVSITNSSATLTLGGLGIDMDEPNSTADLDIAVPLITDSAQSWNIASGRTLSLGIGTGTAILIGSDLTINGSVQIVSAKDFRVGDYSTLNITNDATALDFSTSGGVSFSVGYNGSPLNGDGTVNQTAGVVTLYKNSTSTGALLLGANGSGSTGAYNLNGGSIIDTRGPKDYLSIGDGNANVGILNMNGGTIVVPQIQVGNKGYGYINVTNGSITTTENDLILNKGGSSLGGSLNVYGGTVNVQGNNLYVSKGGTTAFPNSGSVYQDGGVINVGNNLEVPGGNNPGIVTIDGGAMNITNNVILLYSGSGDGTINLNGGDLTALAVTIGAGNGNGAFNFNGGTLTASQDNDDFIAATNFSVNVLAGGAVIDSAGYNITVPASLLNGGGNGGLTKLGAGALTLAGENTYTGPTLIAAGALDLTTTNFAGGDIVLSNAATLHTTVAVAGTTLNTSSLTLGASAGDNLTVEFDAGSFGNPSTVIHATNLVLNGTIAVSVFASTNLSAGVIPLIKYDNVSGSATFSLNFAQGVGGYITNDTSAKAIEFVTVQLPPLVWRALVDTNWDLDTLNWVDTNGSAAAFQNGAGAIFDDSASNSLVNITDTMQPVSVVVSNNALNYTFTGPGKISGSAGLLKEGSGTVIMSLTNANDYSGNTVISNGLFQLGSNEQIPDGNGNGDVILEGKLDLAGFNETINGLSGNNGIIDNSGTNAVTLSVGNNGDGGIFAGQITNSGASLTLNKIAGNLTLLADNDYSGGTINGGDELTLASEQSIGSGPLALNGGTLDWTDASAHTLTNAVTIGGSITLGSATNANGPLTISGTVNLNGGDNGLTCNEDVLLLNGATNGDINTKDGVGTLTLKNAAFTVPGTLTVHQGIWVMDNANIVEDGGNIRLQSVADNGLAGIVVTNGGSLILSNTASANLRVGATDVSGGAGCTNFLDVAGLVQIIPDGTADAVLMGGSKSAQDAEDDVNLLAGGVLEVHQIKNTGSSPTVTALNFNGGVLRANDDDFASSFLQGLTEANVLDGGAIIDTAGYDITVGQSLLSGGTGIGGLTKQGSGILYLSGDNTYTGPTLVSAGGLGGTGSLNSAVTVATGASLFAGASPTNIGALTINNSVTFAVGSSAVMKITKISGSTSSDSVIGMTAIHYGGTLVVTTNVDMTDTFAIGDTFNLFNAGTYSGSFANYSLPALPAGLSWDTSQLTVNGIIQIISAPLAPPTFNSVTLNGGNLVLSGSGGSPGNPYYVLTSTNVALPLSSWTPISTNYFDGNGNFSFTNAVNSASPAQFYNIVSP